MIISNDTTFYYAESIDALKWTTPIVLCTFETIAAYPTAVGLGDDPTRLMRSLSKKRFLTVTAALLLR